MLKRIPKQKFEINKFLIKDFVVQGYFFPPFQPFAVGSGFGRLKNFSRFKRYKKKGDKVVHFLLFNL